MDHPFPEEWHWWAGADEEAMTIGPCASRDEAVELAKDEHLGECQDDSGEWALSFHVVEALENNIDLSKRFDAADWIGRECEQDGYEGVNGEHPADDITPEQKADLQTAVRAAIREWQVRHGLRMRTWQFAATRNEEHVKIPHPGDELAA